MIMIKKMISAAFLALLTALLCCVFCSAVTFTPNDCIPDNAVVLTAEIADGDDNIWPEVQPLLYEARDNATAQTPYVVVIPGGSYETAKSLLVYSNTIVYMRGATIKITLTKGAVLRGGYPSDKEVGGYDDYENMSVVGGTIICNNSSSSVRFAHARNLKFIDITFDGGVTEEDCTGRHLAEVSAIDGFTVTGCTFRNCDRPDSLEGVVVGDGWEALQLDNPCSQSNLSGYISDGTPMKNVDISNNTFNNVIRGIGTHTSVVGVYAENIKICNNTFTDVDDEAVVAFNYYNCEISGNSIEAGRGIRIVSVNPSFSGYYTYADEKPYRDDIYVQGIRYDLKTTVENNNIVANTKYSGFSSSSITVFGAYLDEDKKSSDSDAANRLIPAGDYGISGITIRNNTIETNARGIFLSYAKSCNISGNSIVSKNPIGEKDSIIGISVYASASIKDTGTVIENNTVSGFTDSLICVNGITVNRISGNTLSNTDGIGIYFCKGGKTVGDISSNKLTGIAKSGILINTGSEIGGSIISNTVTSCGDYGIEITDSSAVGGGVSSNEITSCGKSAVAVLDSSNIALAVNDNKINSASGTAAILVAQQSAVAAGINGNTIENLSTYGIYIGSATVSGIENNTVSTSSSGMVLSNGSVKLIKKNIVTQTGAPGSATVRGIYINGAAASSDYYPAIEENTVSGFRDYLIQVNGASVKCISDNVLTTADGVGIFVCGKSKVTGSISSNQLSAVKKSGIYLYSGSTVDGSITYNTLDSCGAYGIILSDKVTVVKNVSSNNVLSAAKNAVAVLNASEIKGKIYGNQIKSCRGSASIYVYKASVYGGIISNTVTDSASNGIYLVASAVSGGIKSNSIINSAAGNGIMIYNKCTVKGSIYKNKIENVYARGINISSSCTAYKISSNSISSCKTGDGIMLNASSKVTSGISSNTIKGIKGSTKCAIFVYNKSGTPLISSNKISSVACNGISVYSLTGYTKLTSNTLSGCKKNSVYIKTATTKYTVTVSDNTIASVSTGTGISVSSGKVKISSNKIKYANRPVSVSSGVSAEIYPNTLSSNKNNSYYIAGKYYKKPSTPKLQSLSALSKSFKASFKGSGTFTGYKLQYARSSSFSGSTVLTVKGTGTKAKTVASLKKGQRYYVSVCEYYTPKAGITLYGSYCGAKSVVCK